MSRFKFRIAGVVSLVVAAVLIFALVVPVTGTGAPKQPPGHDLLAAPQPGERAIIVLKDRFDPRTVASQAGVAPLQVFEHVFNGFVARLPAAAITALQRNSHVAIISADLPVHATAQTLPTGVDRIDADQNPTANIGSGGSVGANVAVLDTGVDISHLDLNVAGGKACNGSSYADDNGHGTHVSGIIGARDNTTGVVGVAPGARIWAIKVLDSSGGGSWSNIICGLDWVVANAGTIDAVNMSLAGSDTSAGCSSSALHQAICNTVNAGVPIAAAAGNDGQNAASTVPAAYPEVVAVSAFTDFNGKPGGGAPANCSTGGTDDTFATYSNYGSVVAIAAPGTCIYSTLPGGKYGYMSGTSMAAPHVTGAMALYKSTNHGASPAAVRSWLLGIAQPQSSSYGFKGGRSGEPVLYLGSGGQPTQPTPTPTPTSPSGSPAGAYQIVGGGQSANSNSYKLAVDGDTSTSWRTTSSSAPRSANVWFDLGASKPIGSIKWVFSQTGSADSMKVQVSANKRTWQTLKTVGNAPAGSWQSLDTQATARYVRFTLTNPNRDPVLGYIAEVQIAAAGGAGGAPTLPTPTPTRTAPSSGPAGAYQITGGGQSANSNSAALAYDGDPSTSWHTTASSSPRSANVWFDLGTSQPIGSIRWLFSQTGGADSMKVQVSKNRVTWQTLTTVGNAPAGSWQSLNTQATARYVRFAFANPNHRSVLGYIAEVQVLPAAGSSSAAANGPQPAEALATPTGPSTAAAGTPFAAAGTTTLAPPLATAPSASHGTAVVAGTGGEGARCRIAPRTDADVIAVLSDGTRLLLRGDPSGQWQPVVCDGMAGFVHESLLASATGTPAAVGTTEATAPSTAAASAASTADSTAEADVAAITATAPPYPIVASAHSSNAPDAQVAYDHDPKTVWVTEDDTPPAAASAVFDLGSVLPIGNLRWLVADDGLQGALRLELSEDGETWVALAPPDELVAGQWQEQWAGVAARYVRFALANPRNDPQLGGLAEVEIWPTDQALPLASLVTPPAATAAPEATAPATVVAPAATAPPASASTAPAAATADEAGSQPATIPATADAG